LLNKAYLISKKIPFGKDKQPRFVISDEMEKIFGDFKGKICIQRNSLRFIEDSFVDKTKDWLTKLK
ncbi:MAG: hypothetical protein SGI89_05600, partial [bacterium]|nr:hypothetical protein [bacterium]